MKLRNLLFVFLLATVHQTSAQSLYDQNTVQLLEIFFSESNWDNLMDAEMSGNEGYLVADSVRINGVTFFDVGVKYKGNSSYNQNNAKNPLHVKLDYINEDQQYDHFNDLKLGNNYKDPSCMREVLSYDILRKYMDAPLSNHINVYINNELMGLYTNDESIDKHFLGGHYFDAEGEFFKCNPQGGAGPGGGGYPDLTWIGTDSTDYYTRYELQSEAGWAELIDLINTLNNNTSSLEDVMDIDRVLWMLAFNNVLVNLDSYTGQFKQNYYLYRDLNNRWVPTVWDLNMSFGGFPGNNLSVSGMQTLIPMYSNDSSHPLIQKLMAIPQFKKMYIAHMRTITNENFANGEYLMKANELMDVIDASVSGDPNGFYTYTQFQSSLSTNITGGGGPGGGQSIPGIQVLMDSRNTYLQSSTEFTQTPPTITNILASSPVPTYGSEVTITAQVNNATSVYLGYRLNHVLRFYRYAMYDDGQHGDGVSGDGVYGASFTMNGSVAEYYIYAENNEAGIFSPERAEHEFYILHAATTTITPGAVVINELLSDNSIQEDEYGQSNDWVEFYNTTSDVVDLTGSYLTDDPTILDKWQFPSGSVILPHDFLIAWIDDDEEQLFIHANFDLSSLGESIVLSDPSLQLLDQVTYPVMTADVSYGRYPNGTGPWISMNTTFDAENSNEVIDAISENLLQGSLVVYPNPFSDVVHIRYSESKRLMLTVVDIAGRVVYENQMNGMSGTMNTATWSAGSYTIMVCDEMGSKASLRLLKQ